MAVGRGIDFSAGFPPASAVKAAGFRTVLCYVSNPRPGAAWMKAKPLTAAAAKAYSDAGLDIVSIYQFGKTGDAKSPSDWTLGFDGGVGHARVALENHIRANGGVDNGRPIYMSVDDGPEKATLSEWNRVGAAFFRGVNSVLGKERTGIYGNSMVCAWAREDDVARWFMMMNWGGDGIEQPWMHIHQLPVAQGVTVGGYDCDVNNLLVDDFGQWKVSLPVVDAPFGGAIKDHYLNTPGLMEVLGTPITGELTTPNGRGKYTHFLRGSIYWTPEHGAQAVSGAIKDAWATSGWESGPLGFPVLGGDEQDGPYPGWRMQFFEKGYIVWNPTDGAKVWF